MNTSTIRTVLTNPVRTLVWGALALGWLAGCSDDPVSPPPDGPAAVNTPPVVGDIKGQSIEEGESFAKINLDGYVEDRDDPDTAIRWTCKGNTALIVEIVDRVATVRTPSATWSGKETLTFVAADAGNLTGSDSAVFEVKRKIVPPAVVGINLPGGSGGCTSCFVSGSPFGLTTTVSGLAAPLSYRWRLTRFGVTTGSSTAPSYSQKSYLPGDYVATVTVTGGDGRTATAQTAFQVKHAWYNNVSWSTYRALSPVTVIDGVDKAFKFVELAKATYDYLSHDWVAAEFYDRYTGESFWLYNRVKKIRFRNGGAEILYALTRDGDGDWWYGNASAPHHVNLAAGSRSWLDSRYRLLSMARIDYPPQFAGDRIHYYR